MAQPILIIGAPRCGTSLTTKLLQACGLYLGRADSLEPPALSLDPKGSYSHLELADINNTILGLLDSEYTKPPKFNNGMAQTAIEGIESSEVPQRLNEALKEFEGHSVWGWKDVTAALTLPYWQYKFPRLKVIICTRNPLSSAASMHDKLGLEPARAMQLWHEYLRCALSYSSPGQRLIANCEDTLQRPQEAAQRLAAFCGLSMSATALALSVREYQAWIEPDLIHYTYGDRDLDKATPEVRSLYSLLKKEAE